MIFLVTIIDSPGEAVMFGTYFAYISKKYKTKEISIDLFCTKLFPWGIPTKEGLSQLWKKQKVNCPIDYRGSDNLLDYNTAIKSLFQK